MGVTLGVTAFAAALTFGASSTHLLDTPRLYGWNWDIALTNYNSGPDLARRRAVFAREPAIEEVSVGDLGIPLDVNGRRVGGIALEPVRGRVLPPVIEGRAPDSPGEVMLGGKTMRTLDVDIGDTVTVRRPGAGARRMRVVGRGVLAAGFSGIARLGQGAVFHARDARRLAPGTPVERRRPAPRAGHRPARASPAPEQAARGPLRAAAAEAVGHRRLRPRPRAAAHPGGAARRDRRRDARARAGQRGAPARARPGGAEDARIRAPAGAHGGRRPVVHLRRAALADRAPARGGGRPLRVERLCGAAGDRPRGGRAGGHSAAGDPGRGAHRWRARRAPGASGCGHATGRSVEGGMRGRLIGPTLAVAALVAVIGAAYVLVVLALGHAPDSRERTVLGLSIAATVVVALAYPRVRDWSSGVPRSDLLRAQGPSLDDAAAPLQRAPLASDPARGAAAPDRGDAAPGAGPARRRDLDRRRGRARAHGLRPGARRVLGCRLRPSSRWWRARAWPARASRGSGSRRCSRAGRTRCCGSPRRSGPVSCSD